MAESLGTAVLDLTTDDSRLRSGLARGERDVHTSFGRMATGVLRSAAGIATAFGAYKLGKALFVDPIKMAGNFQQTLKVLGSVAGISGQDLKKLGDRALKLGADVRLPATSAQDAADAMLALGKAGFSTGQIMSSIHGVLLLSAAAEISNAEAADLVTKAMGAFGLQASDTGRIVDLFAGAANASQSSIQDVGLAMTQAGAGFKALRVPIGDASTAIAVMAKNGITGGMAGAALNVAFTRLANPTKQATETLKDMNVHLFDSNGKFVGVRGAIEQMSPKLAAMSDKQRLATLAILGGTRGMKALSFVLGGGTKAWDETRKAVERAGQAQQIANAKTAGFNGAMSGLRSTLETLQITLGTRVLPKMTEFVRFLARVAGAKSFTVAIKIVWEGLKNVGTDVAKFIGDALFGSSRVVHVGGGSPHVVVDPGLVAGIQKSISDAIAATKWDAVGSRIGTAISAAIKISSKAVEDAMNAMMTWVTAHKGQIADIGLVIGLTMLSKLLDPGFWAAHWQLIGGIALSGLALIFPEGRLAAIGVKAIGFLLKPFAALGTKLAALGVEAVLGLSGAIERALGPLAGRIALWIGDAIVTATSFVVRGMVTLGAKLIEGFINKIAGLGAIFRTAAFTAIVTVIGSLVGAAVGAAVRLASSVAQAILSLPGKLGGLPGALSGAIVGAVRGITGAASSAAQSLASKVANAIKTIPGKLAGLAGDLVGRLGDILGQVAGWARTAFRQIGFAIADGIISGIGNLGSRAFGVVKGALSGLKDKAMSFIGASSPSTMFRDSVGAAIGDGITVGALAGLSTLAARMGAGISAIADQVAAVTKKNASKVGDAFKSWADDAKSKFDAQAGLILKSLDAQLAKGQAAIERMKAKLTPAELQIQIAQAQAEASKVQSALDAAWVALKALKGQQEADWKKLLADQKKNLDQLVAQQKAAMDQLQAAQKPREVDAGIAGFEFGKDVTANQASGNQPALNLLQAKQNLETWKVYYAQGKVTMDDVLRYQEAFDQASLAFEQAHNAGVLAAGEDTNARELADQQYASGQKLLQDYDTWQNLAIQAAAGAEAILTQQAADDVALQAQQATDEATRIALLATFNQQTLDATGAKDAALQALLDYNLTQQANKERGARDQEAIELNAHLVARYNRVKTHLENVIKATDAHFDELARMATRSGGNIGENLAQAMRDAIPLVDSAARALAQTVSKYLKTNSPSELGPMRDLDRWWLGFAPTLIKGLDSKLITDTISGAVNPRLNLGMMTPYASDKTRAMSMLSGGTVTLNQTFHETPANADPVAIGAVTSYALKTLRT